MGVNLSTRSAEGEYMFSIQQSAKEHLWLEAAEACASALSITDKDSKLLIARKFLRHAESDIKEAFLGQWHVQQLRLPALPLSEPGKTPPWLVHINDAKDKVEVLGKKSVANDELSAHIAASLWDAVFGLQVAAWAVTDPTDYSSWMMGKISQGVLKNKASNAVGVSHWLAVDRLIKCQPEFLGLTDSDIYKVRPAMFVLRKLSSDD